MDDTRLPKSPDYTFAMEAVDNATAAQLAAMLAVGPCLSGEGAGTPAPGAEPLPPSSMPRECRNAKHACDAGCWAGEVCTSLDTTETSVREDVESFLNAKPEPVFDNSPALNTSDPASKFRHGGWWKIRTKIWESLQRCSVPPSRLRAFGTCGVGAWVQQSDIDPSRFRLQSNHCNDRMCTPCANTRSRRISDAICQLLDAKGMSFITLTLCGRGEKLTDLVDRLYKHFRALRLHPLWAENVEGGAALLEIKWSDKAQRWHPHLHIVCKARFMAQAALSDVWRGITKDSFIVHIKRITDPETVGHYVTKYASKPLNTSFANTPTLLDEAILALKGRRLCLCFGTWYGTALSSMEDAELADDMIDVAGWHSYDCLSDVITDANGGDAAARAVIVAIGGESRWRSSLLIE